MEKESGTPALEGEQPYADREAGMRHDSRLREQQDPDRERDSDELGPNDLPLKPNATRAP